MMIFNDHQLTIMSKPWSIRSRFIIQDWQRKIPVGANVTHRAYGCGKLIAVDGDKCVVRFSCSIVRCELLDIVSWKPSENDASDVE